MSGKIILCIAVVLVGQTMSASLFDGEEIKKIGDQFSLSAATVGSHFASLMGYPANPSDAQKSIEKLKNYVNSGISDLEDQAVKLREAVRKHANPTVIEKVDEVEKEIKKHAAEAKKFFDEKIGKPIDDKFKDDVKKLSESIVKTTKEFEVSPYYSKFTDMIKVNENSFVNKCREWTSSISETLWNTMTSVFNSLSPISNTCFKYIGGMYYSIKDKIIKSTHRFSLGIKLF